jgi:hypothetical protein
MPEQKPEGMEEQLRQRTLYVQRPCGRKEHIGVGRRRGGVRAEGQEDKWRERWAGTDHVEPPQLGWKLGLRAKVAEQGKGVRADVVLK